MLNVAWAAMGTELSEEIKTLEEFVEGRLKPNLVRAIAERDKVFERQKTFSDLRKNIENLKKNTVTSMRTLVNIGAEIYTEAVAPDTRHIFVEVGHGFYVEFTWAEALKYIAEREKLLSRQIEEYTGKIGAIKVQIKVALEAIRKLLNIPDSEL
ncbi:protein UXT homolog isoform X1 [Salvia splendens]|uniref:protein UXT homolog isoform X1 n=2 Tax=Salvia splendens TaxID=180675 RepID=UPI001C27C9A7|nr:protein UXT homolog isoform X1 [Salvia splendens]XP_042021967.1 protein UXT homolog isoform X1 [Salvia splendens]